MPSGEDHVTTGGSKLLLDLDPDLGQSLDEQTLRQARSRIAVPVVGLARGAWAPDRLAALGHRCFGMLVCDGVVVRELEIAGSRCADLLGPGDLVAFGGDGDSLLVPGDSWHVSETTAVAVLDDRLLPALRAWPSVAAELIARGARQAARSADQRAISQLPRVELRLRALLWHLASRWGRIGADGVVLPLGLTHEALGRLVGARRPTVTLALGELAREGHVVRRSDGAWVLHEASRPLEMPAPTPASGRMVEPVVVAQRALVAPSSPLQPTIEDMDTLAERVRALLESSEQQQRRAVDVIERCRATRSAATEARERCVSSRRPRPRSPAPAPA